MQMSEMLERLREHGMTDDRISKEIKVSQATISKIRRGIVKDPMHSTYCSIEKLYQVAVLNVANEKREQY